jgi:hypothetical protein
MELNFRNMELNFRNTCHHKGGMGRPWLTN